MFDELLTQNKKKKTTTKVSFSSSGSHRQWSVGNLLLSRVIEETEFVVVAWSIGDSLGDYPPFTNARHEEINKEREPDLKWK
jgi:hypothetical protein